MTTSALIAWYYFARTFLFLLDFLVIKRAQHYPIIHLFCTNVGNRCSLFSVILCVGVDR